MLAEMIRNLLSNAVRYTDRGRILLGCRRAGDNVRIEVWDSGVGITEDELPHIFHEHYQGTDGAVRGGFGLGAGLGDGGCGQDEANKNDGVTAHFCIITLKRYDQRLKSLDIGEAERFPYNLIKGRL